jgi:hypothetical protein
MGAEGDTQKEGIKINLGLSTFGRVVSNLSDNQGHQNKSVVPFHDSKLTLLLQDSLGGKSSLLYIYPLLQEHIWSTFSIDLSQGICAL